MMLFVGMREENEDHKALLIWLVRGKTGDEAWGLVLEDSLLCSL